MVPYVDIIGLCAIVSQFYEKSMWLGYFHHSCRTNFFKIIIFLFCWIARIEIKSKIKQKNNYDNDYVLGINSWTLIRAKNFI